MIGLLLLGLVTLVFGQSTPSPKTEQHKTEHGLDRTLDALERGLHFMQEHHSDLNLDGVIGTRLVEGQLEMLLQRLQAMDNPRVSVEAERRMEELRKTASEISDKAMPYVIAAQPDYYARIGPIIQKGFWTQNHASRDVVPSLIRHPTVPGEAMHETDSDDCLTELFGTSGKSAAPCRVSRYCWKLMSAPGYRGYSLSHQLFYMLIAESSGCIPADEEGTVNKLSAGFCANMMVQAKNIAKQHFPPRNQDLFMEIQALCGVAGFRQFFTDEWLDVILSWQWKEQGCWGKQQAHDVDGAVDGARTKREERVLEGGCMSHRTAVALGALVQNVRYIIEYLQSLPQPQQF